MKTINFFITAIFAVSLNITAAAQHNHSGGGSSSNMNQNSNMNMNQNSHPMMFPPKTETLKVWGKCGMCKARIEKIAIANGATTADWNVKTKFLTVVYEPNRSSMDYISGKLAKAGHDTGLKSAKDKAYDALPDCCKYERIR
jgi:hypothetical protein